MIKILRHLNARDYGMIALSLVFIVGQVWLDLKLPDYMAEITVLVQTPGSPVTALYRPGGFMLLCALGSLLFAFIVGYLVAHIATGFSRRLRESVFQKVMGFSHEELGHFSTASLITRTTNDITQIQMLVAIGLQATAKAPIMAAWAIVKILGKSWQWTAATGAAVVLLMILLLITVFFVTPGFTRIQALTDELNLVTRENLKGIRVVRAYNAEAFEKAKFAVTNEALTKVNLFVSRVFCVIMPAMQWVMSGLTLAIYWIGVYIIQQADPGVKLTIFSDMVVFSVYAMQIIMAFMMFAMTLIFYPRARVSAQRVNAVLRTASTILDGTCTEQHPDQTGEVEFRHVDFAYPDAADAVLHDIHFKVRKGERLAIIGSTGSGKSTILHLLLRFYDVTQGEILVDGIPIQDYCLEDLRAKIGFAPQRVVMFRGTVASNVAYGDPQGNPNLEQVQRAVDIAQATDFVEQMEGGLEAPVTQGGTNLSGGQKQRLSIARAIYRNPEIYVFDDSFSALDYKTDRLLRRRLDQEMSGTTGIIVAQRIGTIRDANRILVLDDGRIVGEGTHRTLLKTCRVYREIAESQLTPEEIAHA